MTTLESTKTAFDTWRATRVNSNSPTPTELWDMVKQLLQKHPRPEICKTLGISGNQIKRSCGSFGPLGTTAVSKQKVKKSQQLQCCADSDFVTAMPLPVAGSTSELTLKSTTKSLHLSLPTSALRDVLPMIGELL